MPVGTRAVAMAWAITLGFSAVAGAGGPRRIDVATVEELYAAVGDPANRDVTVQMAPGIYVLSGAGRDYGGALRLQPGMTLAGSEERVDRDGDGVPDPVGPGPLDFSVSGTATVIDGSGLTAVVQTRTDCTGVSVVSVSRADPIIHLGHRTSVTGLTLVAGNKVGIGEPAVLVEPDQPLEATINDTVVSSSAVAVSFANSGCAARGARSTLAFTRNVLRGASNALILENNLTGDATDSTADGPSVTATVSFSRFTSNGNGIVVRAAALGTDGASLTLTSVGNAFSGNRGNIFALGALNNGVTAPAVGNHLRLTSRFDVLGATPVPSPAPVVPGGGVFIGGGNAAATAGPPLGNSVDAQITHASFGREGASQAEIAIFGSQRGADNRVTVHFAQTAVRTAAGAPAAGMLIVQNEVVPGDPPSTARLLGSPRAFAATNPDFNVPGASFFVPEAARR